jgi:hypothetical protein
MANFKNRLKNLESVVSDDGLRVFIFRWQRSNEFEQIGRVTCGDLVIKRKVIESEDEFINRADNELKLASPSKKIITAFAEFCEIV